MFAFTAQTCVTLLAAFMLGNGYAQPVSNCARQYTVQAGDVCDAISAAQNVSTYQLALVNQGIIDASCTNLFVGETLCLGITGQDCDTVHVVAEGESCAAIAQAAGIDFSTLLANNRNVNGACSNIYPGEVLCIAADVIPYSSA